MQSSRGWEPTQIGDVDFCNTQIKEFNNSYKLRFGTVTENPNVYNFVDKALENEDGFVIDYSNDSSSTRFAIDIMDMTSDLLDDILKDYIKYPNTSGNISSVLSEALNCFDREKISNKRIVMPLNLIITGDNNEIIIFYEIKKAA